MATSTITTHMKTIDFSELKRTNAEIFKIKRVSGLSGRPLNRVKIEENPEQYEVLVDAARARMDRMMRQISSREFVWIERKNP